MATIDDIRIKLAVDASEVATGIRRVSSVMDAELRKKRTAEVTLSLKENKSGERSVDKVLGDLKAKMDKLGQIDVKVGLANFDAAPIAKQLTDDLKGLPGGGVKVPVVLDTNLTKKEQAATARDLRAAIGVITVDWQLASQPKGGWPQPPEGWGGAGGFGPPPGKGGGGGGGGGGAMPQPTAGGSGTATKAPRTAAQKANDERLRGAMSARKKAEAASDQEALQKANDEVKRAEAERTRLAKERRAEQKGAAVPPAEPVAPEAAGIGGRRAGQRAAQRAAKQAATGAPNQPRAGSATQIPGTERPPVGRRGDPLANFVGKGKDEKFRRSVAPRDLMAAGRELTAEGQLRADLGMRIRPEDIAAEVKQGETPETVNPFSAALRELGESVQRKKGLLAFAGEYKAAGLGDVETMSIEDARAQLRALKPRQREELFQHLGLPSTVETAAGGALNPINDPKIIQAWQRLMLIPASRFATAAEETGGGIANVNAGARKGGRASGGGQVTGGAVEQGQKQAAMSLPKRAKTLIDKRLLKNISDKEPEIPPGGLAAPRPSAKTNVRAQAPDADTAARMSAIRAGLVDLAPDRPVAPEQAPKAESFTPITTRPATVEREPGAERESSIARALRLAKEREERLREIRGYAEGGRVHHTNQWRQMSLRQRAFQPFCTYCGTFGSEKNPLQADHIKPLSKGGSPFDRRNITTACKNCNTRGKRDQIGWGPPGRAEGGPMPGWKRRLGLIQLANLGQLSEQDADVDAYWLWRSGQPEGQHDFYHPLYSPEERPPADQLHPADRAMGFKTDPLVGMSPGDFPESFMEKNAEGGQVKHTGLLGRMVARGTAELPPGFSVTQVGERGPELIVQGPNGEAEVVPTHQVPTWLARARQGKGFGKDLTGRADGGGISFHGATGFVPPPTQHVINAQGLVQRVFIVNWPAALTGQPGGRSVRVTQTAPTGAPLHMGAASGTRQPGGGGGPAVVTPPGPLPGVGGVAAGQPIPELLPSQDPFFRTRVAFASQGRLGAGRSGGQAERAQLAIDQALNPVRAFTTSVSQVVQTLAGRGELTKNVKAAQAAISEQQRTEQTFESRRREFQFGLANRRAIRRLGGAATTEQLGVLASLEVSLPRLAKSVLFLRDASRDAAKTTDAAIDKIDGASSAFRNLAVGGISAIGAGVAFTTTFAAFNAAFETGAKAIADVTERSTNYSNATAALSEELAKGARASGSSAKAATAATLAASGLADETSKQVAPALAGRAQGVAGNQALQEQVVQIAAAQNIGQGRPQGLPAGFDASLVRSTGGPFNLGLLPGVLSDRSTSDILRNSLNQVPGGGSQSFGGGAGPFRGMSAPGTFIGRGAGPGTGFLGVPPGSSIEKEQAKADEALNDWLKTVTERGQKGGSLSQLVREADQARIDATIKAFESVGADDLAQSLRARADKGQGLALTGAISDFLAAQFLSAQQQAGLRPSVGNIVAQLTSPIGGLAPEQGGLNQLDVQLRDISRRAGFQRETVLPAQQALAFANQPLVPFNDPRLRPSAPLPGRAFADTENTVGQYQTAFEKYAKFAEPAQARINEQIEKGRATLQSWIGPDLLNDITTLGKSIQDIQLGLSQRSLNLEVSQYNNEIRIATRQLGIAQDFTKAIKGNVKDTIGGLQGQNYALGRQLQLLQQELQQRQINLQLALAGFQTPGETSEERAARRDDAEAQAKLAQEQLNLQKQLSGNEFAIGLKENANAITDLTAQIALLREGKSFAIDSFAAQEAIKNMEAELQLLDQDAQSRFDQQVQNEQVLLGIWHDIEAATGKALDIREKEFANLITAFQKAGKAAGKAAVDYVVAATLAAATTSIPGLNSSGSPDERQEQTDLRLLERLTNTDLNGNGRIGAQTGLVGYAPGQTDITVGEAKGEAVAILRNPQKMSWDGGGSAAPVINIIFNNPSVRDDGDLQKLVRQVEEALNRRMQLQGLR